MADLASPAISQGYCRCKAIILYRKAIADFPSIGLVCSMVQRSQFYQVGMGQKGITSLVDKILKRLKMLRFYPPEVVNFRGKLVYTVAVYFVVETVFVLVASWAQWTFDKRVAVIESLNFSLGVLYVATELFLLPDRTKLLVELIQSQPFLYQIPDRNMSAFYKQKRQLVVQLQEKRYKFATILESALKYSFINYLLPPIVSILLYLLHLQTLDQLTLPLVFYLPFTPSPAVAFTSIEQYILLTAIQVAFISYAALLAIIAHVTSFLAVDTVLTEMKLFHLNINDLQHLDAINLPSSQRSQTLSYLIRQITLHHQIICRLFFHKKVNMLRKGFEFQITYMNAFICLHLCLDIYYFLNGANFYKIKYGFLSITLIMVAYIYCENGQKLQQEGENLRLALYNCSWVGKPTWVHRTLLILMTRQNTPLTMRAFNVFTLNRHNLKMILQAAYSYLNLLSHLSK